MQKKLMEIPILEIKPDPHQPRKTFPQDSLNELADSIREEGVIQPIEVSKTENGYMIHFGERRWRAATIAGLTTIPAIVAPAMESKKRLVVGIIENIQREDMNPIDEARAYQRLLDTGETMMSIARKVGRSHPTIKARLIWLQLEPEIQEYVADGRFPRDQRAAKALLALPSEVRVPLSKRLVRPGMAAPVKGIEAAAGKLAAKLAKEAIAGEQADSRYMPSLRLAANGRSPSKDKPASYDALRQSAAGMCNVCFWKEDALVDEPAWSLVVHHAELMCKRCPAWEPGDSLAICKECPAVDLLKSLVEKMVQDD